MDEVWQPDDFLAEFDSDTFDVETHATEILRTGNINDEVGDRVMHTVINKPYIALFLRCRNLLQPWQVWTPASSNTCQIIILTCCHVPWPPVTSSRAWW